MSKWITYALVAGFALIASPVTGFAANDDEKKPWDPQSYFERQTQDMSPSGGDAS